MHEVIILIVILAILFDISNGWNDSANAIATVVSTRVLTPTKAVLLAAGMNILGAFLTTAVAKTIGKDVVDPKAVTEVVVAAALFSGFAWNTAMTKLGLPVSASHVIATSTHGRWGNEEAVCCQMGNCRKDCSCMGFYFTCMFLISMAYL